MPIAARTTPSDAARAIRAELTRGDELFALRLVVRAIDDLRALAGEQTDDHPDLRDFLEPPPTTGSERWDALLATAVGRWCRLLDVARPDWTYVEPLRSWWFVDDNPLLVARTLQRTAPDFATIGIWLDDAAFATA